MSKAYPKLSNEVLNYLLYFKNELIYADTINENSVSYLDKTCEFITIVFLENKEDKESYENIQTQNINYN